jgi:DNA-binding transcriptional ArsR family regulator
VCFVNYTTVWLCYDGAVSTSTAIPQPLPEPLIELVAQRFRVLGEPMRIRLLDRLREGDASVGELQEALSASQQNVSKHLGVLHSAGMVSRTKRGTSVVYAISDPSVFELCDQVCGGVRRQIAELDAIVQTRA